jgi:hypothetical protein
MRSILLTDDNAKGFVKAIIRSIPNIRILPDMTGPVEIMKIDGQEYFPVEASTRLWALTLIKESLADYCKSYSAVSLYTVTVENRQFWPGLFVRGYWHR